MPKSIILLLFGILFFKDAEAQTQQDTVVFYLKNSGRVVSTKDSADYLRVILPPDTNVDKELFRVNEFYPNGRRKLITGATSNHITLKFQGPFVAYFPNGHKMSVGTFTNSQVTGDLKAFYPNGKLYFMKTYTIDYSATLNECRDSVGTALTENGKGKWIEFLDDSFKNAFVEGDVLDGHEVGEWHGKQNDSLSITRVYKDGHMLSSNVYDKNGKAAMGDIYTAVEKIPEFKGGIEALYGFLGHNIRYPERARVKHTQGRVILSFIVEKDGSLTDIKVVQSVGDGVDEEAVRVLKLSPRWTPGTQGGNPVRVKYSMPVGFSLAD